MGIWENLGMGGYRGFSRPAARLLQQAVQLAGDLGCEQADTSHLLLAMLRQQGAAAQFLTRKNITEPEVRRQLAQRRSGPAQRLERQAMAPDLRRTMDYALIGAQNAHVSRAEPEHLLCAMLEDDGCAAGLLLAEMGLSLTEAVRECRQLSGQFVLPAQPRVSASIPRGSRASDKYCRDLTRRAAEGELERIMSVLPNCEATRWNPLFADVVPKGSNKAIGIDQMIRHYGISLDETMAFGDGGNDLAMLRHAAIGVAMGNSVDEVREGADYVTTSVDEDGIYNALKHYGLI